MGPGRKSAYNPSVMGETGVSTCKEGAPPKAMHQRQERDSQRVCSGSAAHDLIMRLVTIKGDAPPIQEEVLAFEAGGF